MTDPSQSCRHPTTFGALIVVEDIEMDGHVAALHRFAKVTTDRETGFAVSVAGDHSFFIELGCPAEFSVDCRSRLVALLNSMTFDGG